MSPEVLELATSRGRLHYQLLEPGASNATTNKRTTSSPRDAERATTPTPPVLHVFFSQRRRFLRGADGVLQEGGGPLVDDVGWVVETKKKGGQTSASLDRTTSEGFIIGRGLDPQKIFHRLLDPLILRTADL